ncbi:hypothetical protein BB560_000329 [Smittium megazygosporum]|uniref:Cell differentiation protein rcd1 n=1 Tax=Smittium megazygosporum TaxID=133381 RepID=A0A2T9ZKP4_9FUNG|nr:hypothetical protein BB560_000329 [Smittium megazygosporum]
MTNQRSLGYPTQNFLRVASEQRAQPSVPQFNQIQHPSQNPNILSQSHNLGANLSGNAANLLAPQSDPENIYYLIIGLFNSSTKEHCLAELSKRRDQHPDLALILWNSYGVMTILYQEVLCVYPLLNPPILTAQQSNRVCNALALLQMIATHEKTRLLFLKANVPQLLYPFLSTSNTSKPFDNLRLTSLGCDDPTVITFFFTTEFLPLCLKIMDIGSELCKVIATFIFQKIIADPGGFNYVSSHSKRLKTVVMILNSVINQLVDNQSVRLLKSSKGISSSKSSSTIPRWHIFSYSISRRYFPKTAISATVQNIE